MTVLALDPRSLGASFQEAKEAVTDALVNLTVARCSGQESFGANVYGRLPQRAFVSGHLLPRFDETGMTDETDDIHISVIGLDFQVATGSKGAASAAPRFSVYVRVMPEWSEISDDRLGLRPTFNIKPAIKKEVDKEIGRRVKAAFDELGLGRKGTKSGLPADWRESQAKRRAIRQDIIKTVYAENGLPSDEISGAQSDDPDLGIDPTAEDSSSPDTAVDLSGVSEHIEPEDTYKTSMRWRHIPTAMAQPVEIPMKWKRLTPDLPTFTWELSQPIPPLALAEFTQAISASIRQSVTDWLSTDDGVAAAWRDVDVTPDDVPDENGKRAWERFLTKAKETTPDLDVLLPPLDQMNLTIQDMQSFSDPAIRSIRVAIENNNRTPSRKKTRQHSSCAFQTSVTVTLPVGAHRPLRPDRIEPSYRFRDHMAYPAIGLNNGVDSDASTTEIRLSTTWAPRFVQPRVVPTHLDIPLSFKELASPSFEPAVLDKLVSQFRDWIELQRNTLKIEVRKGLSADQADRESRRLDADVAAWTREAGLIERGIRLLTESKRAAAQTSAKTGVDGGNLDKAGIPYTAFRLMNQSFLERDGGSATSSWRLFQLAFVLAHLPGLASRIPELSHWHDPTFDNSEASLLYFATGGGKSEAFYGVLVFGLFLDRLRGKDRGVTGLIRYPLRLLTLQQAQRFLRLLMRAELIRSREKLGTWPFEIGFWVGGANTPNRVAEITSVPYVDDAKHPDDQSFAVDSPSRRSSPKEEDAANAYEEIRTAYCKIPECPVCRSVTGLRLYRGPRAKATRVGIVCFNNNCAWNIAHPGDIKTPLPFLLTDDTIYQRAPSVILGTIDKLAMIGQSPNTITDVMGMFGSARWIDGNGHLFSPRKRKDLEAGPAGSECSPVNPAYAAGAKVFFDPFPSLVIQDETHLLEESLGTFSGLFETMLEAMFNRIDRVHGRALDVARGPDGWPRLAKIIAATATVSNPQKQLAVLYQRIPLRFPHPGPELYRSFYAEPAAVPAGNDDRANLANSLGHNHAAEAAAPWMRLFVSIMTNGANHTTTTVAVLSAFHLSVTDIWRNLLKEETQIAATDTLLRFVSPNRSGAWRSSALKKLTDAGQIREILAMVDLHRIALTYVTDKKGGDQVIDALEAQARRDHELAGHDLPDFNGDLITGGIDMGTIQDVMRKAEAGIPAGQPYPDVSDTMRSIVATSAISHGVDVDRFNSMFFAGLPADVAEYIQASSRVGRTHVGFVVLIPTPQSRRDRYVVETHDIFHRFLERMIAAPAAERWAENALRRVTASVIQAWCILSEIKQFGSLPDPEKQKLQQKDIARVLHEMIAHNAISFRDELLDFMKEAIGFRGRGIIGIGKPHYPEHYESRMERWVKAFSDSVPNSSIDLRQLWSDSKILLPPMTSLRDVDDAALIMASTSDPFSRRRYRMEIIEGVMRVIRGQKSRIAEGDHDQEPNRIEGDAA